MQRSDFKTVDGMGMVKQCEREWPEEECKFVCTITRQHPYPETAFDLRVVVYDYNDERSYENWSNVTTYTNTAETEAEAYEKISDLLMMLTDSSQEV